MGFTLAEGLADLAPVVSLVDKAKEIISAVPPKDQAKPSDYIKALVDVLNAASPLADTIAAQAKSA